MLEFNFFVLEYSCQQTNLKIKISFNNIIIKSCIIFTKFLVEIDLNPKCYVEKIAPARMNIFYFLVWVPSYISRKLLVNQN